MRVAERVPGPRVERVELDGARRRLCDALEQRSLITRTAERRHLIPLSQHVCFGRERQRTVRVRTQRAVDRVECALDRFPARNLLASIELRTLEQGPSHRIVERSVAAGDLADLGIPRDSAIERWTCGVVVAAIEC